MSEKPFDFESIFVGFGTKKTPQQTTCSHILSGQMGDGKFFRPSCGLVSNWPLRRQTS